MYNLLTTTYLGICARMCSINRQSQSQIAHSGVVVKAGFRNGEIGNRKLEIRNGAMRVRTCPVRRRQIRAGKTRCCTVESPAHCISQAKHPSHVPSTPSATVAGPYHLPPVSLAAVREPHRRQIPTVFATVVSGPSKLQVQCPQLLSTRLSPLLLLGSICHQLQACVPPVPASISGTSQQAPGSVLTNSKSASHAPSVPSTTVAVQYQVPPVSLPAVGDNQ